MLVKKIFLFLIIGGLISNWNEVSGYLNIGSSGKYSVGAYTSEKWYYDHKGYEEAIRISDENKVPVFIYGYTDWCKYCTKFKNQLLTKSSVKDSLSRFVKVKINPEHSALDKSLYKKLGGKGYPTLLIQSGESARANRFHGPFTRQGSGWKMMSTAEFISMLDKVGA